MGITVNNARDAERWLQSLPAKLRAFNAVDEFIRRAEPNVGKMAPIALARFREIQATHAENRSAIVETIDTVKAAAQKALVQGKITREQFDQLSRIGLQGLGAFVVVAIAAAVAAVVVSIVGYLAVRRLAESVDSTLDAQRSHVATFMGMPPEQRGVFVDLIDSDGFPSPRDVPSVSPAAPLAAGLSAAAVALVAGVLLILFAKR